ncbi:NADP-dependent oxidoreductase [Pseudochryseolinea flava]|uniref:NADP-dependent oxidoreductase n=1 Tax=Pseudochryseolinea flava TaxID=2059302 RepID=A0A364Y2C2_9BACT|nr:NADP-dependent oxidoreductase [Pseudochryseolinea flava]RAW00839.1 NADP-dependent oxidoreductase [Pseudochryseolinea flava]
MRAIVLNEFGPVENLHIKEVAIPVVAPNEVLIKVKAISINPVDVKTRAGKGIAGRFKDQLPLTLGWDVSGTVEAIGSAVANLKVGDDVFGMVNFPGHAKGYAEYVVSPADQLAIKPATISHEVAAASTLAALTAWQGLTQHYRIQKGQRVFIHAAAGGVGHFAIQIAKHFGAYVVGSSSAVNKDFVLAVGADEHFDYQTRKLEDLPQDIDLVWDAIGGDNIDRSLSMIKKGGTIISIPSGLREGVADKASAQGIHGFFFMVKSSGDDMKSIAAMLEQKSLRAHVSKVFPFERMSDAHTHLETGRTVGKVVVRL